MVYKTLAISNMPKLMGLVAREAEGFPNDGCGAGWWIPWQLALLSFSPSLPGCLQDVEDSHRSESLLISSVTWFQNLWFCKSNDEDKNYVEHCDFANLGKSSYQVQMLTATMEFMLLCLGADDLLKLIRSASSAENGGLNLKVEVNLSFSIS